MGAVQAKAPEEAPAADATQPVDSATTAVFDPTKDPEEGKKVEADEVVCPVLPSFSSSPPLLLRLRMCYLADRMPYSPITPRRLVSQKTDRLLVLYGSQSGNGRKFAHRFAQKSATQYGSEPSACFHWMQLR
jgi:hypothetical protein